MSKNWTEEEIAGAISLRKSGKTWSQIGEELGVTLNAAYGAVRRFEDAKPSYEQRGKRIYPRAIHHKDLADYQDCIYIVPIGDIHLGSFFSNVELAQGYIDWVKNTANAYTILMGDIMQSSIKGLEPPMSPTEQIRRAAEMFYPIKDKILGVHSGTHEGWVDKMVKDLDTAEIFCQFIECPHLYRKEGLFLSLEWGNVRYRIYTYHGKTSSRTETGKLTALKNMNKVCEADIYLMAHSHFRGFLDDEIMTFSGGEIEKRRRVYACTGSFQEWGGYTEVGGFSPVRLGAVKIRLNTGRHDIHISY